MLISSMASIFWLNWLLLGVWPLFRQKSTNVLRVCGNHLQLENLQFQMYKSICHSLLQESFLYLPVRHLFISNHLLSKKLLKPWSKHCLN